MKTKPKGTETIAYKESILNGLATQIDERKRTLSPKEADKEEAIKHGLITRLNILRDEFRHRELDYKITALREVIALAKGL